MPIIFTTLDDPSATLNDPILVKGTAARGINGTGQIVGLFSDNNGRPNHGFLFSGGSFTTLDDPSAPPSPMHSASTMQARSSGFSIAPAVSTAFS